MKTVSFLAAAAMSLSATAAFASHHEGEAEAAAAEAAEHAEHAEHAADHAAEHAAEAHEAAADAAIAAGTLSIETPLETLMANEAAAAVVNTHFPDIAAHPMYESFKMMSLAQLAPMSSGAITEDMLTATNADLTALGAE